MGRAGAATDQVVSGQVRLEESTGRAARAYNNVLSQLDPVFFATQRLGKETGTVELAMRGLERQMMAGGVSVEQFTARSALLQGRLGEIKAATAGLASGAISVSDAMSVMSTQAERTAAMNATLSRSMQEITIRAAAAADSYRAMATAQTAFNARSGALSSNLLYGDEYAKRAADIQAYGNELDRLRAKYNPLFAVSKQYETALQEIAAAEKVGAISAIEAAAAQDRLTRAFADQAGTAKALAAANEQLAATKLADALQNIEFRAIDATKAMRDMATAQSAFNAGSGVGSNPLYGDDYAKRATDIEAYGSELDRLRAKYNPLFAVSKQYETELNDIATAQKLGAINATEAAAAQARVTAQFAAANTPLNAVAGSSKAASFALRDLGVQSIDVFQGMATGAPIMTTLIQQGSQVGQVMAVSGVSVSQMGGAIRGALGSALGFIISPMGLLITGAVAATAAVVALGAVAESNSRQLLAMQTALRGTRDDFAAMGAEAIAAGKAVAASSIFGRSDATTAAGSIASSANFAGTTAQLTQLVKIAGDASVILGVTLPESAKTLAQAFDDPARIVQDFADKHLFGFNQALATSIELQARAGDKAGATGRIIEQLSAQTKGAAKDGLTPLQKALSDLTNAFTSSGEGGKSLAEKLGAPIVNMAAGFVTAIGTMVTKIGELANSIPPWMVTLISRGNSLALDLNPVSGSLRALSGTNGTLGGGGMSFPQASGYVGGLPADLDPQAARAIYGGAASLGLSEQIADLAANMAKLVESNGRQFDSSGNTLLGPQTKYGRAMGLMQVMPDSPDSTFATVGGKRYDLNDLSQNALAGVARLAEYVKQFGSLEGGAWAYSAGPLNVQKGIFPDETARNFAKLGLTSPSGAGSSVTVGMPVIQADGGIYGPTLAGGNYGAANDPNRQIDDALKKSGGPVFDRANAKADIDQYASALKNLADQGVTTGDKVNQLRDALNLANKAYTEAVAPIQGILNALNIQIDAENRVATAWKSGAGAAAEMTARVHAEAEARKIGGEALAQNVAAVQALTDKYRDNAAAVERGRLAQAGSVTSDETKIIRTQIDTIGMESIARQALIQHMKNEQDVARQYPNVSEAERAARVNQLDTVNQMSQALQRQQAAVDELGNAFSQGFDTIGNSITQSLVSGQGAAVNWANVMTSAAQQVLQAFLKLAVINPLLNSLLSSTTHRSTLEDLLGGVSGGGSGGATLTDASGNVIGTLSSGSSAVSSTSSLLEAFGYKGLGEQFGLTGPNGIFSGAGSSIAQTLATPIYGSAAASAAADTAIAGSTVYGPITSAQFAAAGGVAPITAGAALGAAGGGFAVGSLIGTGVQSLAGKTGPGPEIGAAVGTGAGIAAYAIGTALAPETFGLSLLAAALIGGAIGGAGGGLIGPGPQNKYSGTEVGLDSGRLIIGQTRAQLVDGNAEREATINDINAINSFLGNAEVKITSLGQLAQVGQNTPGGYQDPTKAANLATAFPSFQFDRTDDPVFTKFLAGKSFPDLTTLATQTAEYLQLIKSTIPALTEQVKTTTEYARTMSVLNKQFDDAIATAQKYGVATDALTAAQADANKKALEAVNKPFNEASIGFGLRFDQAAAQINGDPALALSVQLRAFDIQAQQQRDAFKDQLITAYGEAIEGTAGYNARMLDLERALGEERLVIQKQYNDQIASAATQTVQSLSAYALKLQFGAASPLSPQAQLSLAQSQFNAVSGAAAAGNFNSIGQLPGYADSLLTASRTVNGSGAAYAATFQQVLDALTRASQATPDTLTASVLQIETRTQTQRLEASLAELKTELQGIRQQMQQNGAAPLRNAA